MATPLSGYYNRFDSEKNYEKHLFRAGYVLQSAEMNEIQDAAIFRTQNLGDALFRDGDVIRDALVIVDSVTGATTCESGVVYLRGAVRGVPSASMTIPLDRTVAIGIWLTEVNITVNEDPALRDPAAETRNYQEPGAARLMVEPKWGFDTDGTPDGEFYPIYYADNGRLRAKEAPPAMDGVSQAIARYDRDSTGSSYIVSGLNVRALDDLENGNQVYNLTEGRARINGFGLNLNTSRRVEYAAAPVLRFIDSEPRTSTTIGSQRIDVDRAPISEITQVRITMQTTVPIVHGTFSGAQDPLPETSVVDIISVTQGATTYVKGTDYKLTAGRVDWSLSGAEPAPGTTYNATFQFIDTVEPTSVDDTGFTISGAVVGTLILTSYNVKLPRIDRMCLNQDGVIVWVEGISTDYNPVRPQVPNDLLPLCQVQQNWTGDRVVVGDGVRMVPMSTMEMMGDRINMLTDLVAQQLLISDASTRETAATTGMFVDPFLNDDLRDAGIAQTGAIIDGMLTLAIEGSADQVSLDVATVQTCAYTLEPVLSQELRTGAMNINPYMAFSPIPAKVSLTPSVDRWTETETAWASIETRNFTEYGIGGTHKLNSVLSVTSRTSTALVSSSTSQIEYLREIEIQFEASGFGPGEILESATFDGIPVTVSEI